MDANPKAPLAKEVEPGAAVPVPLEELGPVAEGVAPERMIEAAFSASAYVGAISYDTKNQQRKGRRSNDSHVQRTKWGIPKSPRLSRSL